MKSKTESSNLRAALVGCFAILFLTVMAFGCILVQNFHYVDQRTLQMNQTMVVVEDIQELKVSYKSAESSLRYAFLHDAEDYLEDYYKGWEYPKLIGDIRKDLTTGTDDPIAENQLDQLESILEQRFNRFDEVFHIWRAGGRPALDALRATGQNIGLNLSIKTDTIFKNLLSYENGKQINREKQFHESEKLTTQFLAALIFIMFIFFGFSGYVIWKLITKEQHQKYLLALTTELEAKVKERTAELVESNKEMESFSYSVSHDLRAPLRAIEGYSVILTEDFAEALGEEGMKRLKVIISNVHNMSQLIDDILAFSRLGRKDITKSNIDLTRLAESAVEEVKKAQSLDDRTIINLQDLGFAYVDAGIFRQVFTNLIGNAAKFSFKSKSPEITVGTLGTSPQTYFIRDNGVGFDMKHANKLFNVFQRLHSANDYEGTGVGLAIVKKVVTKHGGRVWAESSPNSGATFYFSLA